MLACLDDAKKLERCLLAVRLKDALGTPSLRDGVLYAIDKTFAEASPHNRLLRDAILLLDANGDKTARVAAKLNLSLRTFFRRRETAVAMIAKTIDRILHVQEPLAAFKAETATMIASVNPSSVAGLIEREAYRSGGKAAYEAILVALRSGREVSPALLSRCAGHWRLLADLEIARTNLDSDDPAGFGRLRSAVGSAISSLSGAPRDRVAFEWAYVERLEAVRRCDVAGGARATHALNKTSGDDFMLRALAAVCRTEQACDEGDLHTADSLIQNLQSMTLRLNDFRVSGRTSHVSSILSFLRGNYEDAKDLSQLTIAALDQIEPGYVPCAAGIQGRAELLLGGSWQRPVDLFERFPRSYITGMLGSVWARHLATARSKGALAEAERSIAIGESSQAWGTLAHAQGTLAIVLELLGKRADAQRQRVKAWECGVPLGRPFYLYDMLIHPALPERAFGAFDVDDSFLTAVERRLIRLLGPAGQDAEPGSAMSTVIECLGAAVTADDRRWLRRWTSRRRVNSRTRLDRGAYRRAFRQLSVDLAYCLPVEGRNRFISRFSDAASAVGL